MNAPKFRIDLNKYPSERYSHILRAETPLVFKDYDEKDIPGEYLKLPFYIKHLVHARDQITKVLRSLKLLLPLMLLANQIMSRPSIGKVKHDIRLKELEGMAAVISTETAKHKVQGISLSELVAIQYAYEYFAQCTSVGINPKKSTSGPIHVRTMDWPLDFLTPLTIELEYYKDGESLFKATSWLGFTGVFTGMRTGGNNERYSISLNYRSVSNENYLNRITGFFNSKRFTAGQLIRSTLETVDDFGKAVSNLKSTSLLSPCYFTIIGSFHGHGLVIQREANPENQITYQSLRKLDYIVQTNADQTSPLDINSKDIFNSEDRLKSIESSMIKVSKSGNQDLEIWKMMEKYPVCSDITIYGTIMKPFKNFFETKLPVMNRRGDLSFTKNNLNKLV
jgi:hypothetical protein